MLVFVPFFGLGLDNGHVLSFSFQSGAVHLQLGPHDPSSVVFGASQGTVEKTRPQQTPMCWNVEAVWPACYLGGLKVSSATVEWYRSSYRT